MILRRRSASARLGSIVALASLILVAEAAFAATPTVVRDRPRVAELGPVASADALAWAEFTRTDGMNTYVRTAGEPRIRLNGAGQSFAVGIDGSDVVYDLYPRSGSPDLRFFDLGTHTRSAPPSGVNTSADEYAPARSGDWLSFTRTGGGRTRIVLFNLDTSEQRILSNRPGRTNYMVTDQVQGDWATWERCRFDGGEFTHCEVFLYRISTEATTMIPNPGRQQYGSAVTSDGTVYFARGGDADRWTCGVDVELVRLPFGGSEETIATIPEGREVLATFALEEMDGSTTLLLERNRCNAGFAGGIYAIADADTTT